MPQISYDTTMDIGIVGNRADSRLFESEAKQFHEQAGTWTLTVGGTATAGDYVYEVGGIRFTFTRVSETNAQIGDEINAQLSESLALSSRISVTDDNAGVVTIVALFEGDDLDVTAISAPAPGTLVAAETVSPDAGSLEVGLGVCQHSSSSDRVRQPASTDDADDFAGVLMLGEEFAESVNGAAPAAYEPGSVLEVAVRGSVWVAPEEAITSLQQPVYMRIEASGSQKLGAFRASAAGGQEVVTVTPTAAELEFNITVQWSPSSGAAPQSVLLSAPSPDGSTTATEICNEWRTAFAAAQADGALTGFTAGGTATLVLTGPAGESFTVIDNGEGVSAVVYTTAADVDAIRLPGAKWKSLAAADQPCKLHLA